MRAAIINAQGVVENIIAADEAFCAAHHAGRYVMLSEGQFCDLGWVWNGKKFNPPA